MENKFQILEILCIFFFSLKFCLFPLSFLLFSLVPSPFSKTRKALNKAACISCQYLNKHTVVISIMIYNNCMMDKGLAIVIKEKSHNQELVKCYNVVVILVLISTYDCSRRGLDKLP